MSAWECVTASQRRSATASPRSTLAREADASHRPHHTTPHHAPPNHTQPIPPHPTPPHRTTPHPIRIPSSPLDEEGNRRLRSQSDEDMRGADSGEGSGGERENGEGSGGDLNPRRGSRDRRRQRQSRERPDSAASDGGHDGIRSDPNGYNGYNGSDTVQRQTHARGSSAPRDRRASSVRDGRPPTSGSYGRPRGGQGFFEVEINRQVREGRVGGGVGK